MVVGAKVSGTHKVAGLEQSHRQLGEHQAERVLGLHPRNVLAYCRLRMDWEYVLAAEPTCDQGLHFQAELAFWYQRRMGFCHLLQMPGFVIRVDV